jgi:hypothetical protein
MRGTGYTNGLCEDGGVLVLYRWSVEVDKSMLVRVVRPPAYISVPKY